MKTFKRIALAALLISAAYAQPFAKSASVCSPNGSICATVSDNAAALELSVTLGDTQILASSPIALEIAGQKPMSRILSVKQSKKTVKESIVSPFYRQSEFEVAYNYITVGVTKDIDLEVRVFDDGVAYRYVYKGRQPLTIIDEKASYKFPGDPTVWLPYSTNDDKPFAMAYQNYYDQTPLSHAKDKYAFLPVTVDCGKGVKLTLTESDLEAYPGMFIKADTIQGALFAAFAQYPKTTDMYQWRKQEYVTETEPYIAKCPNARTFPWRIFAITTDDTQMPTNNLVYALASPSRIADTNWIKPGKVAWDWWNDWGLKNVPFRAGINMDTYKYYIDFASENGLEYVILDEGWYDPQSGDMLTVIPKLNLPELIAYASEKNVGIVLWTVFNVLDAQLEEACTKYKAMGVAGFKVDFLDRDDQTAVEMVYRVSEATAKYELILDLHGIYKPTGLNRTYPNVLNFEAVFGMEEMKWSDPSVDMPAYDVTFPYIRLLAGPVDYTPGAMRNASMHDWKAIYRNPMSMGTRCHQLATYIVYDSPFTMLCDAPSNYKGEEECVEFIADIPVVIDETRILCGEMGKYIVTARRNGNEWWIGGLTNWQECDVEIDLKAIGLDGHQAVLFYDGPNADEQAEDYVTKKYSKLPETLSIHMASGGGFACRIYAQ